MEKNSIKVYARLKLTDTSQGDKIYEITKKSDYHELYFKDEVTELAGYKFKQAKYRFQEVFDQTSTQAEVFQCVAKPVVNSLLQGYNGTIFAYGQTGSGKTYTIRGVPEEYSTKGIIPRTIQYVFDCIQNATTIYAIFISYMEIYNEVGYDLLNSTNGTGNLEELPRVSLLEDSEGNIHLKNLQVISVSTEKEAMKLLYLGESNRKFAETPMNPRSSRSHCVFTVYVSGYMDSGGIVRRSKLHLVDLAGSERIHKTCLTGTNLTEALHINLSLHFLEQVMLALSDSKRTHIPYRNSLMTTVLRDSLGGNCLTTMLATLSVDFSNIHETISTCKFSQRVALVKSDATIIEEYDAAQEIASLKLEIDSLRKQLVIQRQKIDLDCIKFCNVANSVCNNQYKGRLFFFDQTTENNNEYIL